MTDTTNDRVRRMILQQTWEAYVGVPRAGEGIPVDLRCPGCGVERDGCDSPLCTRYLSEGEE